MMELLGPMPKNFAVAGKQFENFFSHDDFSNKFTFKKIKGLKHYPLHKLLVNKYRFKEAEANMLAEFLLPMLQWYPSDRASAQHMLEHPWLTMPDEYNYRMSDLEFNKYSLKQRVENVEKEFINKDGGVKKQKRAAGDELYQDLNVSELGDSDSELNAADREDNITLDSGDDSDDSFSMPGTRTAEREEEFNINTSFTGGYVPNTDLARVDKGQGNPQFRGFNIKT